MNIEYIYLTGTIKSNLRRYAIIILPNTASISSPKKPKSRLIRLTEVLSRTGYGRTSINRKMDECTFPKCLKLGSPIKDPTQFDCRAIAWIEDEIDQWVEARIEERDSNCHN